VEVQPGGLNEDSERLKADPVVDGRLAYLESQNERLRAVLSAVVSAHNAGLTAWQMAGIAGDGLNDSRRVAQ